MKRRTLRQVRARNESSHHHHVYVVLLHERAREWSREPKRRGDQGGDGERKPCVYVGMTGLSPEARFENHLNGVKSARVVERFGVRLLPELFEHLNPMPYDAAVLMEADLADDLRSEGYCVFGGH